MQSVIIRNAGNVRCVLRIITKSCSPKFDLAKCAFVVYTSNKVDRIFTCALFCVIGEEEETIRIEFDEVFEFDDERTFDIDMRSLLSCRDQIEDIFEEILAKTVVIKIEKLGDGDISEACDYFGHVTLKSPLIKPNVLNARLTEKMMKDLFV